CNPIRLCQIELSQVFALVCVIIFSSAGREPLKTRIECGAELSKVVFTEHIDVTKLTVKIENILTTSKPGHLIRCGAMVLVFCKCRHLRAGKKQAHTGFIWRLPTVPVQIARSLRARLG